MLEIITVNIRRLRQNLLFLIAAFYVHFISAASHHPQTFLKEVRGKPHEGEKIVEHYCALCHASNPMIQVGAPRMGQPLDWAPRMKQGLEVLIKHTDEGLNAMPPRGGCFECSDEQLKLAVLALLPKGTKNSTPKDLEGK